MAKYEGPETENNIKCILKYTPGGIVNVVDYKVVSTYGNIVNSFKRINNAVIDRDLPIAGFFKEADDVMRIAEGLTPSTPDVPTDDPTNLLSNGYALHGTDGWTRTLGTASLEVVDDVNYISGKCFHMAPGTGIHQWQTESVTLQANTDYTFKMRGSNPVGNNTCILFICDSVSNSPISGLSVNPGAPYQEVVLNSSEFESGACYIAAKSTTTSNREMYFGDVYVGLA